MSCHTLTLIPCVTSRACGGSTQPAVTRAWNLIALITTPVHPKIIQLAAMPAATGITLCAPHTLHVTCTRTGFTCTAHPRHRTRTSQLSMTVPVYALLAMHHHASTSRGAPSTRQPKHQPAQHPSAAQTPAAPPHLLQGRLYVCLQGQHIHRCGPQGQGCPARARLVSRPHFQVVPCTWLFK